MAGGGIGRYEAYLELQWAWCGGAQTYEAIPNRDLSSGPSALLLYAQRP